MQGFSKMVGLLTQLTRKDKPFTWMDKSEEYFEKMKRRLLSAPVLAIPNMTKAFEVYYDTSYQVLGCVLI